MPAQMRLCAIFLLSWISRIACQELLAPDGVGESEDQPLRVYELSKNNLALAPRPRKDSAFGYYSKGHVAVVFGGRTQSESGEPQVWIASMPLLSPRNVRSDAWESLRLRVSVWLLCAHDRVIDIACVLNRRVHVRFVPVAPLDRI